MCLPKWFLEKEEVKSVQDGRRLRKRRSEKRYFNWIIRKSWVAFGERVLKISGWETEAI